MLDKSGSAKALHKLFRRFLVVDMDMLSKTLQTKSRMSIFRRLREIGYLSSYTHTGRFYTLAHIPQFDDYGLWFHQSIGFSRFGTLKATIVELVDRSSAGLTHSELNHILRVRVHNALLGLVREGRVQREHFENAFLYVRPVPDQAAVQVSKRCEKPSNKSKKIEPIPATTVIEVLIETIHAGQVRIDPSLVANRLSVRGVPITVKQVEQIFIQYAIASEKKIMESGSTHLKR
jgi:hypothetical protein